MIDWRNWHNHYDLPGSPLARRLEIVQAGVRQVLDDGPPGPLRAISLCSGQGRDLLEVLDGHPRRADVRARLVERDPHISALARQAARAARLPSVEVLTADAALTDHYRDIAPADLVLICGVFGNISDPDIRRTIGACTQLCKTGGTVIWTRHRGAPDRVPAIRAWFAEQDFDQGWLSEIEMGDETVGAHRFTGDPQPLPLGESLFSFTGYETLLRTTRPKHD